MRYKSRKRPSREYKLFMFTLDKQAWYLRQGWTMLAPCVWHRRSGDIMSKRLLTANESMKRPSRLDLLLLVVVPSLIHSVLPSTAENDNLRLVDIGGSRKMY
jgi:hypothetical protein